jgi:hypothetical protein
MVQSAISRRMNMKESLKRQLNFLYSMYLVY